MKRPSPSVPLPRAGEGSRRQGEGLTALADRIYQRDRVRFRKLAVWLNHARKDGWSDDRIHRALVALDVRAAAGTPIADWWPWLNRVLRWLRTRDLQRESDGYKHQDLNSFKAILKKISQEVK